MSKIYVVTHVTFEPDMHEEFKTATLSESKAVQYVANEIWKFCEKKEMWDSDDAPESYVNEIKDLYKSGVTRFSTDHFDQMQTARDYFHIVTIDD